jgi:hypothetical protein
MKYFTVDITILVTVRLHENKFVNVMPDLNSCISNFDTDDDALEALEKHIARLAVEVGINFDDGEVEDIDGHPRPCSRCQTKAFDKWADSRRPNQQTRKSA